MVGDVVGRGGRHTVSGLLPALRDELNIDFAIVQGENTAGGFGMTRDTVADLLDSGADVVTSGNHVWDRKEFLECLDDPGLPALRPMNYPDAAPGRGCIDLGPIAVVNLIGRVFVGEFNSPFEAIDDLLASGWGSGKPILVDFHAEATSEKAALAWHLDGRAAAVCGTHTHVPTADARVLPGGTAFISDLGMVGSPNSVIGMHTDDVLARFMTGIPYRMKPVEKGPMKFNSALIEIEDSTSLAIGIERVDREWVV